METNPALNMYRKLSKMKVEPIQEPKGGLLSKTMSTKATKYKPNVDVSMRVARYLQDIKDYNNA
jgi:hypothetical protein|tara:strand:+ start:836 stop:1027 length:192 start_codon:yes stop_codon:yes gene_type:complete